MKNLSEKCECGHEKRKHDLEMDGKFMCRELVGIEECCGCPSFRPAQNEKPKGFIGDFDHQYIAPSQDAWEEEMIAPKEKWERDEAFFSTLTEKLEELFPKRKCKERGQALVLNAYANLIHSKLQSQQIRAAEERGERKGASIYDEPTSVIAEYWQNEIRKSERERMKKEWAREEHNLAEALGMMYEQYCSEGHVFMSAGERASTVLELNGFGSFDDAGRGKIKWEKIDALLDRLT